MRCFLCEKLIPADEVDDMECFGCGKHICTDCDVAMPMGSHEPEDHRGD